MREPRQRSRRSIRDRGRQQDQQPPAESLPRSVRARVLARQNFGGVQLPRSHARSQHSDAMSVFCAGLRPAQTIRPPRAVTRPQHTWSRILQRQFRLLAPVPGAAREQSRSGCAAVLFWAEGQRHRPAAAGEQQLPSAQVASARRQGKAARGSRTRRARGLRPPLALPSCSGFRVGHGTRRGLVPTRHPYPSYRQQVGHKIHAVRRSSPKRTGGRPRLGPPGAPPFAATSGREGYKREQQPVRRLLAAHGRVATNGHRRHMRHRHTRVHVVR